MAQRREAAADAAGGIEGQQATGQAAHGFADGGGVQQQRLAAQHHLAQGQAKALVQQLGGQFAVIEEFGQGVAGALPGQGGKGRIGQQDAALAVHRQHRIGHGGEQSVELQGAALAGQDVHHPHRLHPHHGQQGGAQFFKHRRAQGRRIDVDVGRHHLHGVQVEIAGTEQRQDFLGDADTINERHMDTHGNPRV